MNTEVEIEFAVDLSQPGRRAQQTSASSRCVPWRVSRELEEFDIDDGR